MIYGNVKIWIFVFGLSQILMWIAVIYLFKERQVRRYMARVKRFARMFRKIK